MLHVFWVENGRLRERFRCPANELSRSARFVLVLRDPQKIDKILNLLNALALTPVDEYYVYTNFETTETNEDFVESTLKTYKPIRMHRVDLALLGLDTPTERLYACLANEFEVNNAKNLIDTAIRAFTKAEKKFAVAQQQKRQCESEYSLERVPLTTPRTTNTRTSR